MGRADFLGSAHILHYTRVFGYVNKTCLKQAGFTGCVLSGVLQNRFPAGNEFVPSPDGDQSIFL